MPYSYFLMQDVDHAKYGFGVFNRGVTIPRYKLWVNKIIHKTNY